MRKRQEINGEMRRRLTHAFEAGRVCRLGALSSSAAAFLAAGINRSLRRGVAVVTDNLRTMDELRRHLEVFHGDNGLMCLPPAGQDVAAGGERIRTLYDLADAAAPLVITCVQALMQTAPPVSSLRARALCLRAGVNQDPAKLAERLAVEGYDIAPEVQEPGQAARRGGLLDVWPPGAEWPYRVEFFGDTVDTLRRFDPLTQRSQSPANELVLLPEPAPQDTDAGAAPDTAPWETPAAQMPADSIFLWFEPSGAGDGGVPGGVSGIAAHAEIFLKTAPEKLAAGGVMTLPAVRARLAARSDIREMMAGGVETPTPESFTDLGFRPLPPLFSGGDNPPSPDIFETHRRQWLENLARAARHGRRVRIHFGTPGALQRFHEMYPGLPFELRDGALMDGFDNDLLRLTVVSESNLTGRRKRPSGAASRMSARRMTAAAGDTISNFLELAPGDLVVHVEYGIGRYLGLHEIEFNGKRQEVLSVEYAEQARLYVPASQAHLLSRYVGAGRPHTVTLHRLGGLRWKRERGAAENAVRDLAAGLLEVQALRRARVGFAFPPDTAWQHEFENAFPYQETADQEAAIRDVKHDMETPRPMDRLVCGDAGYGKTEVAMRAAFKCAMAGRQTALLAPTTVLAQQHFECFRERLAAFPVRMELLCRFQSPSEQMRIVRETRAGAVDIVIGTHRLVQPDVTFKDLGLVIIDEEQRFGVEHKERLKQTKQLVDMLTLTATPIPRTLYMSLAGVREISVIQTPPRERRPVETIIARDDDKLVREAILRELDRAGQVFFLYNRVMTIQNMAARLRRLAPEARIGIGHGQMPAAELERVMHAFAQGDYDILLCTTIIESGLDIANANTIIIDRADRFGMAELYQLRGRVGRADRKAHAYLLLPHGHLMNDARRRLGAMTEYSGAGAGFRLALRDLEIRGAGNLLGAAQSGHIAAVGFDLYCRLLRRAVAALTGKTAAGPRLINVEIRLDFLEFSAMTADTGNAAFLPADYIEDERLRLDFFRRLAAADAPAELEDLGAELADRFGPPPAALKRLIKLAELRALAAAASVSEVETRDGRVMLRRHGEYVQQNHQFPRLHGVNADDYMLELAGMLRALKS